jgi:hypothetical protein
MERSLPTDLVGVAQLRFFGDSIGTGTVYSKCAQNTATGRGHYSGIIMLSLCMSTQPAKAKPNYFSQLNIARSAG